MCRNSGQRSMQIKSFQPHLTTSQAGLEMATLAIVVFAILTTCTVLPVNSLFLQSNEDNRASPYKLQNKALRTVSETTLQRHRREEEIPVQCSTNYTVTAEGGFITSPRYPEDYPNNVHCEWRLVSSTSSNIILTFTVVGIEEIGDCRYDYVAVYDEEFKAIEKICGSHSDKIVNVNSTAVTIVFHSDETYAEKGFELNYLLEMASDCPTILNQKDGILKSPLYPSNYPDNTDCRTTIIVEQGTTITLKFDVLNLEYDEDCSYDYVDVYDGATSDAPMLGHFCSNPENAEVTTTNNTMFVHFHSDQLLNFIGFFATYSSTVPDNDKVGDCKWEKELNSGTITSPGYPQKYPSNAKCAIKIEAPEDNVISITIDDMNLETGENCSYDRVEIRDGIEEESPLLQYFCGRNVENKEMTSTANGVYVGFRSDSFEEFGGFRIKYRIHEKGNKAVLPSPKLPPPTAVTSPQSFIEFPQDASAISGESYVMSCIPEHPKAKVRWMRDGQMLEPIPNVSFLDNEKILWIHSMSEETIGNYTCVAVMPDDTMNAVHAQLNMKEQAENCNLLFRHTPKNTTILQGDSKFIECSLVSSKSVEIKWTRNGVPLEDNEHYQQLINGFLLIAEATLTLSGVYTCVAQKETTGCIRKYSAFIQVLPRTNVDNVCGRPKIGKPNKEKPQTMHGRVVGGSKSTKGAYPWQVMLRHPERGLFCGGSLLNEHWVVTAAHCLYIKKRQIEPSTITVELGKYDQFINEPQEFVTGVGNYFIHPQFDKRTFNSDIAMIKLMDSIQFTDFISPICLGDHRFIEGTFFEKTLALGMVTGWGRLTEDGPQPRYLQELRLPIVDQETCRRSTEFVVTENMFCAGYAQEIIGDTCKGDSGGPLVMEHEDVWYLVGIVSWGKGCGRPGQYGFYTKVNIYHAWIKSIIN